MLFADFLTADLEWIMSGNNGIMSGNDCRLLTLLNAGWGSDIWERCQNTEIHILRSILE